jgi:hypothetical protein
MDHHHVTFVTSYDGERPGPFVAALLGIYNGPTRESLPPQWRTSRSVRNERAGPYMDCEWAVGTISANVSTTPIHVPAANSVPSSRRRPTKHHAPPLTVCTGFAFEFPATESNTANMSSRGVTEPIGSSSAAFEFLSHTLPFSNLSGPG